jgi:hypothetical protein
MTTEKATLPLETNDGSPKSRHWLTLSWWAVAVVTVAVIAYFARTGAVSDRIRNPEVTGSPRPVRFLFGISSSTWMTISQLGTLISLVIFLGIFVWAWRRWPAHPVLLMAIVTTIIVWQDPIMNWAPYAVYNPQLWHWPEDWPLVSLSPTVEPFIVILYATFYLGPYFPSTWILRKIQAKRPVDSFVWRHPLVSLAIVIYLVGFVFDAFLEITNIRTGLYIYSQVIPFGSLFTGTTFQFPLIWESSLVTLVMIPSGVLLYRDDTGRTVAEKLAQRARIFVGRPALGTFAVMLVIINLAYFAYGAGFTLIKWSRTATSVACLWPYPEAKVYDPQGFYEKAGAHGPYSVGIWSTWMSAQPNGRPNVAPPVDGGPCGHEWEQQ